MKALLPLVLELLLFLASSSFGGDLRVFVALADNKSQGIAPVPEKIGNSDDAARNLYWGCDEALPAVFRGSGDWKYVSREVGPKPAILERMIFSHRTGKWRLIADVYRGSAIRDCLLDYFQTVGSENCHSWPISVIMG